MAASRIHWTSIGSDAQSTGRSWFRVSGSACSLSGVEIWGLSSGFTSQAADAGDNRRLRDVQGVETLKQIR